MLKFLFLTQVRFGFYHQSFIKLWRVRGKRNKKPWFRDNSFYFQVFFSSHFFICKYQLTQIFLNSYQYLRSYSTLSLKLWHEIYKISSNCVAMSLFCRVVMPFFDMNYSCVEYYCQKVRLSVKDTHREKVPSNKTPLLTKSRNMGISGCW